MASLPPLMYRLTDSLRVKRPSGVFWTLTFAPKLPTTGPPLDARHRIVTVSEARYEALKDHGPNWTGEEITVMEKDR